MNGAAYTGKWDYLGVGVPLAWRIAAVIDLNNDTKADLIWQNTQTGDVSVWWMKGINYTGWNYIAREIPTDWQIVRTHY